MTCRGPLSTVVFRLVRVASVNSSVQTCEGRKPHAVDVFAVMCVHMMSKIIDGEKSIGRTFELLGAYRQRAVKPSSTKYAHIIVQQPGYLDYPLHADLQSFPREPRETLPNARKIQRTTRKNFKTWDKIDSGNLDTHKRNRKK